MNKFDINAAPLEIERRYLIEYPDIDALRRMDGYRVRHISQTYLQAADDFVGGRIRRIVEGDQTTYVYTDKMRLTDMTRREYEKDISAFLKAWPVTEISDLEMVNEICGIYIMILDTYVSLGF